MLDSLGAAQSNSHADAEREVGRQMNVGGHMLCAKPHAPSRPGAGREGEQTMPVEAAPACSGEPQGWLAADVGGTHARLGLVAFGAGLDAPTVLAYRVYKCAEYAGLELIVQAFCEEYAVTPNRLAVACAGFLHDGLVVSSHLKWPIEPRTLKKSLGLDEVEVLNDFEALAYATAYMAVEKMMPLHASRPSMVASGGPVVVIGPGTGLGVAVRLPGSRPLVLATEAGHIQLAARVGREQQVLKELAQPNTHVPYDHVLSGPGLLRLYQAVCRLEQQPAIFDQPQQLTAAATAGEDALAVETLQLFCGWLGSFAGDMAMLYGATGGVYLAGGFLARTIGFLQQSVFTDRFLDKGVMRPFLQTVPVHVVDHGQLAVIGAASRLRDRPVHSKAE